MKGRSWIFGGLGLMLVLAFLFLKMGSETLPTWATGGGALGLGLIALFLSVVVTHAGSPDSGAKPKAEKSPMSHSKCVQKSTSSAPSVDASGPEVKPEGHSTHAVSTSWSGSYVPAPQLKQPTRVHIWPARQSLQLWQRPSCSAAR